MKDGDKPSVDNTTTVTVDGEAVLTNLGFNGDKKYADKAAMSIKAGAVYLFECWLRRADCFLRTGGTGCILILRLGQAQGEGQALLRPAHGAEGAGQGGGSPPELGARRIPAAG